MPSLSHRSTANRCQFSVADRFLFQIKSAYCNDMQAAAGGLHCSCLRNPIGAESIGKRCATDRELPKGRYQTIVLTNRFDDPVMKDCGRERTERSGPSAAASALLPAARRATGKSPSIKIGQKLRDRASYFVALLDWQHVRFSFKEMNLGARNQIGCLLASATVEQLIRNTSDDECWAYNLSAVLRVVFEVRSKQLAVITQDRSRVAEISGQPVFIPFHSYQVAGIEVSDFRERFSLHAEPRTIRLAIHAILAEVGLTRRPPESIGRPTTRKLPS
jgi:hypothetical protein